MTLFEFKKYFKEQLSEIYTPSESEELFYIFAEKILDKNKFELRRNEDTAPDIHQQSQFYNTVFELKSGKPYQQILGEAYFFGMKFFVNEHVLIPRPETEELLELAIEKIRDSRYEIRDLKILDIGTGSGIIPIVLKKHFPDAEISAIDFSEKALETAEKNAEHHEVSIRFIHTDYLTMQVQENFDVIISNPPYIGLDEQDEIANSVKDFEPKMALFSPVSDPLIFYRKIAEDAENILSENGMIFLEINQKLGKETLELFESFKEKALLKDISGNNRMIFAKK